MADGNTNDKQVINTGHHWKPGESGNPAGRPKKGQSLTDVMREFLETTAPAKDPSQPSITYKEAFVRKVYKLAMEDGSESAMRLIWNYIDGMPLQGLDVTSKGQALNPLVRIETNGK